MNENTSKRTGPGLLTFTLLWGIVTQCLNLAGIISWPWLAIWGPALINVALIVAVLLVTLLTLAVAWISGK